ncbi:MAG: hypothetical protein KF872_05935 [Chitinophagales bacterium]|nr:hypothetical protein [Chitinophagales bacterium]
MKNFLTAILIAFTALAAQTTNAQTQVEKPEQVVVAMPHQDYELTTVGEILNTTKVATFADSLQVVAKSVSDPEFKSLLLQAAQAVNQKPLSSSPESWISWIGALVLTLGAAIGYLIRALKPLGKILAVVLLFPALAQSCVTCAFTSDYSQQSDSVKGCVECYGVSKALKVQPRFFKLQN